MLLTVAAVVLKLSKENLVVDLLLCDGPRSFEEVKEVSTSRHQLICVLS